MLQTPVEGILLIDKPESKTSFYLVKRLRQLTKVKKIGHAGTLDPFATGLMILLIGKNYTRKSDLFLNHDKSYLATIKLGSTTASFDKETEEYFVSDKVPTESELKAVIDAFQGEILQTPPMFSAKKVQGKPLYELARQGISIERKPCHVKVDIQLISYSYPEVVVEVNCSKGTYIRSLGHDIGQKLGTGAHLTDLRRLKSGSFLIENALKLEEFEAQPDLIRQRVLVD